MQLQEYKYIELLWKYILNSHLKEIELSEPQHLEMTENRLDLRRMIIPPNGKYIKETTYEGKRGWKLDLCSEVEINRPAFCHRRD